MFTPKGVKLKLKKNPKPHQPTKENQQKKRKIKATLQEVPKGDKNGLETSMCLQSPSSSPKFVCN